MTVRLAIGLAFVPALPRVLHGQIVSGLANPVPEQTAKGLPAIAGI